MSEQDTKHVLPNTLRLIGDVAIAPGTSLLVDGKFKAGAARVAAGLVARAVLGPVGWLAVAADSYTKSTTGRGLIDRIRDRNRKNEGSVEDGGEVDEDGQVATDAETNAAP
ncbi:MAG: hypothetical protein KC636_06660 [Myxococcales bacterium]|nr:hypothetical protein [Myxococcales bacterium]